MNRRNCNQNATIVIFCHRAFLAQICKMTTGYGCNSRINLLFNLFTNLLYLKSIFVSAPPITPLSHTLEVSNLLISYFQGAVSIL